MTNRGTNQPLHQDVLVFAGSFLVRCLDGAADPKNSHHRIFVKLHFGVKKLGRFFETVDSFKHRSLSSFRKNFAMLRFFNGKTKTVLEINCACEGRSLGKSSYFCKLMDSLSVLASFDTFCPALFCFAQRSCHFT